VAVVEAQGAPIDASNKLWGKDSAELARGVFEIVESLVEEGVVGVGGGHERGCSTRGQEVQRVDERLARPFTIGSGDSSW